MSIITSPLLLGADSGIYQISRSLRFDGGAYLNRTIGSASNRRTFTWSGWVKRSGLGGDQQLFFAGPSTSDTSHIRFDSDNTLNVFEYAGSYTWRLQTAQVFRDCSAWFHLLVSVDTTLATASDRVKVYVNGVQVTTFSTASYPSQNTETEFNNTVFHQIGRNPFFGNEFNGYQAEIFWIDGQALDPSSFTTTDLTTGQLIPKAYTGSYGTGTTVATATGALPIFNTTDDYGKVKGTGTRTDSNSSSIVLAVAMDGANNGTTFTDQSATIKGSGSAKTLTVNGNTKTSTVQSYFYGSSAAFDGSGDYLSATNADFAFGTGDFTVECWVRIAAAATEYNFVATRGAAASAAAWTFGVYTNSKLFFYTNGFVATGAASLNADTWYHVAVTRSASIVRLYLNGIVQDISSPNTQDFSTQTLAVGASSDGSQGNLNGYIQDVRMYKGLAKYTSNFLPVIPSNGFHLPFSDNSTTAALGTDTSGNGNTWTVNNFSVTQGTGSYTTNTTGTFAANRGAIKAFDGATSGSDFYAQPADGNTVTIGSLGITGITKLRMWLGKNAGGDPWGTLTLNSTNVTSFLTTNYPSANNAGQWVDLTAQLPGSSLSTITMTSPVANTDVRLSAVEVNDIVLIDRAASTTAGNDSLVDTPTSYGTDTGVGNEVRGNYCTLNPLDSGGGTVSNGNLEHTYNSSNLRVKSTISIPATGKWYAEFVASNAGGGNSLVGIATGASALTGTNWYLGNDAGSWGLQIGSGTMYTYHNGGFSSFGTANNGDVIGVAVDRAAGKIWWSVNNTWIASGDPANGTNARYSNVPATDTLFFALSNANSSSIVCNWGQRAFAYTAPSGFKALVDTNLPAPLVAKPNTLMDAVLWTGNGSTQTITLPGAFSPDFVWGKSRSNSSGHYVYDTIRGTSVFLQTENTGGDNNAFSNALTAFNSNGFSLGSNSELNGSSRTYVGWCWDAGTSTVTNTAGSISSQVRANASAGFSVVSYTGTGSAATVGHGLGVAPAFMIFKNRSASGTNWFVYHQSLGATKYLLLDSTVGQDTSSTVFNNTNPTSSVLTVGTWVGTNGSGNNMISYCFSPVSGYSSISSYQGNGSSDGTFVYTGFRPRWLMIKRSDASGNGWYIVDTTRSTYNVGATILEAQSSAADYNASFIDILSNGFKLRATGGDINSGTIIYAAFAESPFQYARAR